MVNPFLRAAFTASAQRAAVLGFNAGTIALQ